ncbi:lysozyme inhibitor LprI family protein [Allocoleopsis franciscana]|uniref:Lysozyme inhibitor LprI-like N-terminal domain-containing protein n=1 Tax=Allocoleopsis franciscana PCC 7113 TaxID=1173027 RepID=K9WC80_9CYAN|nr:lysozyme inhibitor LprI family protein [Allocoleopsis franciscana]AFZ17421.1 hypothetical protein Mic7113_1545 [Allocoleopsis franciscana PCC 7113]
MYKKLIHVSMLVIIAFCLSLASSTPSVSQAANSPITNNFAIAQRVDCSNAQTTVEMKYCSQQYYQAADKQLNQAYQKVISSIKGEQKGLLTTAQQAWIRFRDNNCNFEVYPNRGGTGYEIFRNGCLERLTKQRTKDLQDYLSNR